MEVSHFVLGVATGVPVMIVVGPIALLLIEAGIQRGLRGGSPAAVGVASADLVFSTVSALAGVAAARALAPVEPLLSWVAIVVLVALAWHLWRSARAELGRAVERSATIDLTPQPALVRSGAAGSATQVGEPTVGGERSRGPVTMAAGFFAVTVVNPITIVVFTSIVVGGAEGVGTLGWVLGMTAASLMVNFGFLSIGCGLGAVLTEPAAARLRMAGAVLVVGLAVYFALS